VAEFRDPFLTDGKRSIPFPNSSPLNRSALFFFLARQLHSPNPLVIHVRDIEPVLTIDNQTARGLNQRTLMETFTTTIFVVLFWLPLIPTGTYRVQRKKQLSSSDIVILEKLSLDWTQALGVWALAAVSLLALIVAYKWLPSSLTIFRAHQ
jgi:hypothetical protein